MAWNSEPRSGAAVQAALVAHGPRLAATVLAGLLAVQAGFLVTAQRPDSSAAADARATGNAAASLAATADAQSQQQLQLSQIVSAHLFGEAARPSPEANAPQTAAQLVLAGVLALHDPKRGLAIIGPSAAAARLYAVGAAVTGGVSLYAVYRDHVLLDRGGSIESLALPRQLASGPAPTAETPLRSPAERLAALVQSKGGLLGGLLRAQPVFNGRKLSGYRVFPGSRASIGAFTKLGLHSGDLVTAVNGTVLDDPNRGNEIVQTLSSSATATLTVLRNGQSQELNLNLETAVSDAENAAAQAEAAARRGGAFGGPLNGPSRLPGLGGNIAAPGPVDEASATPPPPPVEPPESATDHD